eukprot:3296762-Amphidinium_carterae.1
MLRNDVCAQGRVSTHSLGQDSFVVDTCFFACKCRECVSQWWVGWVPLFSLELWRFWRLVSCVRAHNKLSWKAEV